MAKNKILGNALLLIVIPSIVFLATLAVINYNNTKQMLLKSNTNKNVIISDEVINAIEFQDIMLEMIESGMYSKMNEYSNKIVSEYLANTNNAENIDLNDIRLKLGMNPELEDIYIINKSGIVVNTTFEKDKGMNFFEFGQKHKDMLLSVFQKKEFIGERFAVEAKSKRIKKYSYQASKDGNYIVELGFYSKEADETINFIKARLNILGDKHESIESVDLFIGADVPFSLNKDATVLPNHMDLLKKAIETKEKQSIIESNDNKSLHYEYIYMNRKNTDLYSDSVIRIISDRSNETMIKNQLYISIGVFILVLVILTIIYFKKLKKHDNS